MRNLLLGIFALCLSASIAVAQGKVDAQWNCSTGTDQHSVDVGDQPGHSYAIGKFTCSAAKGELEGIKEKDGAGAQFDDMKGNASRSHGVFVESLSNGDSVHYIYQGTAQIENGKLQSASNAWTISGGTGKFKGAKGKGTCKGKGNADGSSTYDCTGEYTLAK